MRLYGDNHIAAMDNRNPSVARSTHDVGHTARATLLQGHSVLSIHSHNVEPCGVTASEVVPILSCLRKTILSII